ncbi:hypothetical protein FVEN_g4116 [Fusarium venenatum]|uniref:Uncharacterized protein n=1 Tax=Fusarium venenatum TaxID=56646 RepID=A0A2L2TSD2_9HYPO|nr:uncharacterized protein FVRRES_09198 [Fusarium venenatum]KAG8358342.1 hypothetical protein FVEN_g4116 [Fusarium venenatum]KAH6965895.1 hypothetical protein EDB82DRAFT_561652 [Fusarium venenatum]CEI69121.1 unnamed protein product [Fusarium venenatum]
MSDISTPKTNAWTDEAKASCPYISRSSNELLLRIIAQLKPEGKSINWNEITMEGRTMKSLQNQWTAFNKKIDALKQQAADAPSPSAKKTPGRKRGPKPKTPKMVGSDDDDDDYGSPKKSTPRKRRAPKAEIDDEASTKAIKMELNETIKAEDGEFDYEV